MKTRRLFLFLAGLALIGTMAQAAPARGQVQDAGGGVGAWARHAVVGTWFGRAVPVDPFCEPGTAECPIPPEVVMTPHFFADGSFIGNDSLTLFEPHTTAHGQWVPRGRRGAEVNYLFMTSGPGGLSGALRFRFIVEKVAHGVATGVTTGFFFPFADENGQAVLDDAGFPTPSPTEGVLPEECLPGINGCLATFRFEVRRIERPKPGPRGRNAEFDF